MLDALKDNANIAMFMAAGASIGVFWNQFKGLLDRISSILVVTHKVEGRASRPLMVYAWAKLEPSKYGRKSYDGGHYYVRPLERYAEVPMEAVGSSLTFWDGWKPLFISGVNDGSPGGGDAMTVTYMRGMFDIEKLLIKAFEYYNDLHSKESKKKRYHIKRYFGYSGDRGSKDNVYATKEEMSNPNESGSRPLGFQVEDLGDPVGDEPFASLAYDEEVTEFIETLKTWIKSKAWYKDRNITWRLGGSLTGLPGTGKTSLVRAFAQEVDMPIAMMDLTSMSNDELVSAWRDAMEKSPVIVLFEDLDRIFDHDKNLRPQQMDKAPLTLDCLLNCISGVENAEGVLTLVTANHKERLDPALGVPDADGVSSRPGRLDISLEFKPLNTDCRVRVANRILRDNIDEVSKVVKEGHGETGAQFTKRCSDLALRLYWKEYERKKK